MSRHSLLALIVLLVSTVFASACARPLPEAPTRPGDDPFPPPERIELPGVAEDPARPFSLLPGDLLSVRVISLSPLETVDVPVQATGWVHVPLAGDVEVGGLTLGDAASRIERAYGAYDRHARVVLTVKEARGHRATVVGAIDKPGSYVLEPDTRLAELFAKAGGSLRSTMDTGESVDAADLPAARLVRSGVALPVSVERALTGDVRHNVRVSSGDLLYVPPAIGRTINVIGEVNDPRAVPFRPGMRLSDALALAGGPTDAADNGDVRVVRGKLSAPRVYRADLGALLEGEGGDIELAAGDTVFVTKHWFASTTDVVGKVAPALAAVAIGAALSD